MVPNSLFSGLGMNPGRLYPNELFNTYDVSEYCEAREREIDLKIQRISHSEILSLDRETVFTRLVNSYLSDESTDYPALDIGKTDQATNSNQTMVRVTHSIPWTGAEGFFAFKPANKLDPPSDEVRIHLDQFDKKVTFNYELPLHDPEAVLEERFLPLLKNDIKWVVNSLDDVIRHFRDHENRLMRVMGKALERRVATVYNIEGVMERAVIPDEIYRDKLSVMSNTVHSRERHPRYEAFKQFLFGHQKGQCNGTELEILYNEATVDHIIPQAAGGGDELGNLQVLCAPCNGLKADGSQEDYLSKINDDCSICSGFKT